MRTRGTLRVLVALCFGQAMRIEQLEAHTQATAAVTAVKPAVNAPTQPKEHIQNGPERVAVSVTDAVPVPDVAALDASMVEFSLDADSGRVVVKIIDSATQEVVRQIPMEEMLALAKALDKFQGLLLQTKA
jgi:flagellar protein FlaG